MRLGLIGPAQDNDEALERAAQFLAGEVAVDRAIYLDVDHGLERVVSRWATELVGGDPSDDAIWQRAAERCAEAAAGVKDAETHVNKGGRCETAHRYRVGITSVSRRCGGRQRPGLTRRARQIFRLRASGKGGPRPEPAGYSVLACALAIAAFTLSKFSRMILRLG